jgi:hypothetical protein
MMRDLAYPSNTDGAETFADRADNQQAPARCRDRSDEEAQEPVRRIGDAAAAIEGCLHQRVALGSIERQDSVPDLAAGGYIHSPTFAACST